MTLRFRGKVFLAAFVVGVATAIVVGLVLQWWIRRLTVERIEATLSAEARLAAELLTRNPGLPLDQLDDEADRMGQLVGIRVTLIADDGRVLGDSAEDGAALASMENHAQRPRCRPRGRVPTS